MTRRNLAAARSVFLDHFAATFLAAHAANEYLDLCAAGKSERLADADFHPVEDAICIGEAAWENYVQHRYPKAFSSKRGKNP